MDKNLIHKTKTDSMSKSLLKTNQVKKGLSGALSFLPRLWGEFIGTYSYTFIHSWHLSLMLEDAEVLIF